MPMRLASKITSLNDEMKGDSVVLYISGKQSNVKLVRDRPGSI